MNNKEIVFHFLDEVRSGKNLKAAVKYLAPQIIAHQMTSEHFVKLVRTPQNYANHVLEMQNEFGNFAIVIEELIADGDKVFASWLQYGVHIGTIEGFEATGLALTTSTNAVYRIANQRIVEYWIQHDRKGLLLQLERNQSKSVVL